MKINNHITSKCLHMENRITLNTRTDKHTLSALGSLFYLVCKKLSLRFVDYGQRLLIMRCHEHHMYITVCTSTYSFNSDSVGPRTG